MERGLLHYRETVSPWLRSLFYLSPDPQQMAGVPAGFKIHVIAAFALRWLSRGASSAGRVLAVQMLALAAAAAPVFLLGW